jgi:hypothetical protein
MQNYEPSLDESDDEYQPATKKKCPSSAQADVKIGYPTNGLVSSRRGLVAFGKTALNGNPTCQPNANEARFETAGGQAIASNPIPLTFGFPSPPSIKREPETTTDDRSDMMSVHPKMEGRKRRREPRKREFYPGLVPDSSPPSWTIHTRHREEQPRALSSPADFGTTIRSAHVFNPEGSKQQGFAVSNSPLASISGSQKPDPYEMMFGDSGNVVRDNLDAIEHGSAAGNPSDFIPYYDPQTADHGTISFYRYNPFQDSFEAINESRLTVEHQIVSFSSTFDRYLQLPFIQTLLIQSLAELTRENHQILSSCLQSAMQYVQYRRQSGRKSEKMMADFDLSYRQHMESRRLLNAKTGEVASRWRLYVAYEQTEGIMSVAAQIDLFRNRPMACFKVDQKPIDRCNFAP